MKEILNRAKAMILKPLETWQTVKTENATIQQLFIDYAAPLALIPFVAALIGLSIVGIRMPAGHLARAPFFEALTGGVVGYIFHLLGLLAGAWAVTVLAPYLNSKSDFTSSVKLIVFSMTPIWLLGALSAFPGLGILQIFGLYSIYLIYLGLPILLDTPKEKVLWFTVIFMIAWFVISLILGLFVYGAVNGPMLMRMMAS